MHRNCRPFLTIVLTRTSVIATSPFIICSLPLSLSNLHYPPFPILPPSPYSRYPNPSCNDRRPCNSVSPFNARWVKAQRNVLFKSCCEGKRVRDWVDWTHAHILTHTHYWIVRQTDEITSKYCIRVLGYICLHPRTWRTCRHASTD